MINKKKFKEPDFVKFMDLLERDLESFRKRQRRLWKMLANKLKAEIKFGQEQHELNELISNFEKQISLSEEGDLKKALMERKENIILRRDTLKKRLPAYYDIPDEKMHEEVMVLDKRIANTLKLMDDTRKNLAQASKNWEAERLAKAAKSNPAAKS